MSDTAGTSVERQTALARPVDEKPDITERSLPIRVHLTELKRRLTWSVLVFICTTVVAIIYYEPVFKFLMQPAGESLNPTIEGKFVFNDVTEAWGAIAKVGIVVGLILGMPFFLLQVVLFLRPGLHPNERKMLYLLLPAGLISFAGGVFFSYYVLLPPAIQFLLGFASELAEPFIRIGSYVNLIVMLMFWMGLIFEIPLVMYFLARIGILKTRLLSRFRRWAYVLGFVLGAIITPTFDPVNQLLVAGPIIVMFEAGFLLARLAERSRSKSAARGLARAR